MFLINHFFTSFNQKINLILKLSLLVKPLTPIMALSILVGVLGFIFSISLPVLGTLVVLKLLSFEINFSYNLIVSLLIFFGFFRGFLRYLEHYTGHYIAFKILALYRNKIFEKLRKLDKIEVEKKQKGNILSLITSDIENLEVFYAHTISPIAIASITGLIIFTFITKTSTLFLGLWFLVFYFVIGALIPLFFNQKNTKINENFKKKLAEYNSFFLDKISGVRELILFNLEKQTFGEIKNKSISLEEKNQEIKNKNAFHRSLIEIVLYVFSFSNLFLGIFLLGKGLVDTQGFVISTVTFFSSFGPVIALSNLPSNLGQTFASAERVFSFLKEKPDSQFRKDGEEVAFSELKIKNLSFGYDQDNIILKNINLNLKKGKIIGISGKSGAGKSTLLKLIMNFWGVEPKTIMFNNIDINNISTYSLNENISYFPQETYLFLDTIKQNIALNEKEFADDQIINASKKAEINDFITNLPNSYNTFFDLSKKMDFSTGEKQRIGLARTFLKKNGLILMDEPTSNIDIFSEKLILKSIEQEKENYGIIIVSHKKSIFSICDEVYELKNKELKLIR